MSIKLRYELVGTHCIRCNHWRAYEDEDGEIREACLFPGVLDENEIENGQCSHFVLWDE